MTLQRRKIGLDQIGLDWIDFETDKIVLFEMGKFITLFKFITY